MAKHTVLEDVKNRMQDMIASKAAELDKIDKMQQETITQIEAAALAEKQATERMDLSAYEEASNAKRKAQTALEMYRGRHKQLSQQEYISEEESDKVIDSLLRYEAELEEGFKTEAAGILKKLAEVLDTYRAAVDDTEETIRAWNRSIHANYSTRGGTSYHDSLTGERTDRSPKPVPVHAIPYTGCKEATAMAAYLQGAAALWKD